MHDDETDWNHDHDHGNEFHIREEDAGEDIEGLEMFRLRSVGIDIGSSTSHLVFSQLTLRRQGTSYSSQFMVTDREVLYRSPIMLTPYLSGTLIDTEKVRHQHFNLGGTRARYLALHPPYQFHGYSDEKVQDLSNDQIEYSDEDLWIREKFEEELDKRGLTSLMPDEAYRDPDYQWDYQEATDG